MSYGTATTGVKPGGGVHSSRSKTGLIIAPPGQAHVVAFVVFGG